ncbi:hypothetical protein K461DRAFT_274408 [Myriangium duriaei CBS 260.36]|uniref:Pre-rRNA-processing protein RIX1 n=1 Tax=Myriangium duriaei CBS 260.36 TaxID=1168546 RepID=A0A9P4JAQ8_9PEZI|nr:hypothetical protein K461DRAFT_274408 [Myriangium duriaei CBS 260.36]
MAAATAPSASGLATLRSISLRISSAKPRDLPHIVAAQVHSLRDCGSILSHSWSSQSGGAGGEAALVVHRLHTQIVALLQGRHEEQRWAATVLIKAAVEVGGHETLSRGKHWVSGLLANLRKSDSSSTKALEIITLTRILMLTWPFPSLVREITTPALPQFVKTCLQHSDPRTQNEKLLRTILECLLKLIPHHPTIFRTHVKEITEMQTLVLGATETSGAIALPVQTRTRIAAARLGPLLHTCQPKQGSGVDYGSTISAHVANIHGHADTIFMAVEEIFDSDSKDAATRKAGVAKAMSGRTQTAQNRSESLYRAAHRLAFSLDNLTVSILNDSGTVMTFPVKEVHGLILRLLGVVASQRNQLPRFVAGTSREERDSCIDVLPQIHVATLRLTYALFQRFAGVASSLAPGLIQQIHWLFEAESAHSDVRTACYTILQAILSNLGPSLTKQLTEILGGMLRHCCDDVLPNKAQSEIVTLANSLTNNSKQQSNGSFDHKSSYHAPATSTEGLRHAASALLQVVLANIPRSLLPDALRSQLDRTAVLSGQDELLTASVLNPSKRKDGRIAPSLLPFLARTGSSEPVVEALLRPRAPVLQSGSLHSDDRLSTRPLEQEPASRPWTLPSLGDTAGEEEEVPTRTEHVQVPVAASSQPDVATQQEMAATTSTIETETPSIKAGLKRPLDESLGTTGDQSSANNDNKRIRETEARGFDAVNSSLPEVEDAVDEQGNVTASSLSAAAPTEHPIVSVTAAGSSAAVQQVVESDDDDDDFVIPDLNMDDSDEE